MKTTLLALTLNGVVGVKAIKSRIDPAWFDRIIFVNGGSREGTIARAILHGGVVFGQRVAEIPGDKPARIGRKLRVFRWGGASTFQILRQRFFC